MRILHVSTFLPPLGGVEIVARSIAERQAELGHKVIMLTSDQYVKNNFKDYLGKVVIYKVPSIKLYYEYLTFPKFIPWDVLKRVDIVQGYGHSYYFVYSILKASKQIGKPTALYFIGVDYLQRHSKLLQRMLGFTYQRYITRNIIRYVDLAIVANEYDAEVLKKRYGIEAVVLPHGVDERYLWTPNLAEMFRRKYNIPKGAKVVGYMGRIHESKGLDLLIKAFKYVYEKEPNAILVIVGRGDERYLRKCLSIAKKLSILNHIRYLGYVQEEDKIGFLDAADVIVLPTRHPGETYPLLVDEVKSRYKPIIVTNVSPALVKLISMYEKGVVVPKDNDKALAEAILRILVLSNSMELYATRKGRFIQPKHVFTWREIARILCQYYYKRLLS